MHLGLLGGMALFRWQPSLAESHLLLEVATLALQMLPPLLLILGVLYAGYPRFSRWPYRAGMLSIVAVALAVTGLSALVYDRWIDGLTAYHWLQLGVICLVDSVIGLYYLDLLQRAYSPAIAEARLQALQARIRPHFLFNSLNAVLSLIRSQPKQAEAALEDMAELFRVLMADNAALVPLSQEISLCQQYLNIEKLRLGERLQCDWQLSSLPADIRLPPLILQPLIENAVYHGIEPLPAGGRIVVTIQCQANTLSIRITNPLPSSDKHAGNKMAMKNIRERLRLHYDLEAHLRQHIADQHYVVEISLPTRHAHEVHSA